MPSAICPHCNEPAFSSVEFNKPWTCPTCHQLVIPVVIEVQKRGAGQGKDSVVEQYSRFWIHE
ncbi:MAG: hypothetical protein IRZ33_04585 [Alicyclobacillaceae bacterium]|nr:hypothetical protein [Alicyclobacillaceae bacterium]